VTQERESKFRLYSKGVVVNDKPFDTHIIQVTPIEDLPYFEEPFREWGVKYDVELPDAQGNKHIATAESKAHIDAEWLALHHPNRITAPDVVAGEMVDIYRYSDSEKYYWDKCRRDEKLRKLEHVVWAFNDSTDHNSNDDPKKQYRVTVSTKDGYVELRTSTYRGEPVEYTFRIDTKNGGVDIKDSNGNYISLNSVTGEANINTTKNITLSSPIVNINAQHTYILGELTVEKMIHGIIERSVTADCC